MGSRFGSDVRDVILAQSAGVVFFVRISGYVGEISEFLYCSFVEDILVGSRTFSAVGGLSGKVNLPAGQLGVGDTKLNFGLYPSSASIYSFFSAGNHWNKLVEFWWGMVSDNGELQGSLVKVFEGGIDSIAPRISKAGRGVIISASTFTALWDKAPISVYGDAEHRLRYVGDNFFSLMGKG